MIIISSKRKYNRKPTYKPFLVKFPEVETKIVNRITGTTTEKCVSCNSKIKPFSNSMRRAYFDCFGICEKCQVKNQNAGKSSG